MYFNGDYDNDEMRELYEYTNYTNKHINAVNYNMKLVEKEFVKIKPNSNTENEIEMRGICHDASKLNDQDERDGYIHMNMELKNVEYGSDKYKEIMDKYNDVIQLHYSNNSHHPEHYSNGINGMSLLDKIEMICDWCAVIKVKQLQDSFNDSFLLNKKRFNISDDEFEKIMNLSNYLILGEELKEPNYIIDLANLE